VVVVDDDFAVAGLHRGFVEADGRFEVLGTAHTGADALRLVEELDPDLLLLDVYLPDMTGVEVIRDLRHREHPVDVIAITAARELETVRAAMAGGVLHYLVKPFPARVLKDRLDDYLERWKALQQSREQAEQGAGELTQQDVDRLLSAPRGRTAVPLPKGLSARTLAAVAAALAERAGSASAQEVGESVGISRVSARRYLEHLVATGRAAVTPRYGSAGRPENRYSWVRGR
jgi:response regulator of citrate/malate metabolism